MNSGSIGISSGITPSPTDVLMPKYYDHHELEEIVKAKEAEAIKVKLIANLKEFFFVKFYYYTSL